MAKIAKIIFLITDALFLVVGGLLILVGTDALSNEEEQKESIQEFFEKNGSDTGLMLLIVGVVVIAVAVFGFVAGFLNKKAMLMVYILLVVVVIIGKVATGVMALQEAGDAEEQVEKIQRDFPRLYVRYETNITVKEKIDNIQKDFKCCGPNGSEAWISGGKPREPTKPSQNKKGAKLPPSCCPEDAKQCTENEAHEAGCLDAVSESMEPDDGGPVLLTAFISIIVDVAAIGAATFFCFTIKKKTPDKGKTKEVKDIHKTKEVKDKHTTKEVKDKDKTKKYAEQSRKGYFGLRHKIIDLINVNKNNEMRKESMLEETLIEVTKTVKDCCSELTEVLKELKRLRGRMQKPEDG